MRFLKTQAGFSLLEVMIVAGLMMVISLAAAQFISNQNQQVSYMEDRMSKMALSQEVNLLFNNPTQCAQLLGQEPLKKVDPTQIKIISDLGRIIFDPANKENVFDHIKVKNATMKNLSVKGANHSGEVEVALHLERMRASGKSGHMSPVLARVPVVTNSEGVITACYPKRKRLCGGSIKLKEGKMPNPMKDYKNCCPGGGSLFDCVTTGLTQFHDVGTNVIYFICTCE